MIIFLIFLLRGFGRLTVCMCMCMRVCVCVVSINVYITVELRGTGVYEQLYTTGMNVKDIYEQIKVMGRVCI